MKPNRINRLLVASLLLFVLMITAVACQKRTPTHEGTTPPQTLDTVASESTGGEPETQPAPTVSSVLFPSAELPDYAKYATANRIKEVLGSSKTFAVACAFRDLVVPAMASLRAPVDEMETLVPSDIWPLPTYGEMTYNQ